MKRFIIGFVATAAFAVFAGTVSAQDPAVPNYPRPLNPIASPTFLDGVIVKTRTVVAVAYPKVVESVTLKTRVVVPAAPPVLIERPIVAPGAVLNKVVVKPTVVVAPAVPVIRTTYSYSYGRACNYHNHR
jgi:hypothetical protein